MFPPACLRGHSWCRAHSCPSPRPRVAPGRGPGQCLKGRGAPPGAAQWAEGWTSYSAGDSDTSAAAAPTQAGRACASRHPAAGRGQGRGTRGDARTRPALTRGARHAPARQVRQAVGGSGAASAPDPGWESGPRRGHGRLSPQAQRAARWGRGPRARGRWVGGHGNSSSGAAVGTEQPSSGCTRLPPAGLS